MTPTPRQLLAPTLASMAFFSTMFFGVIPGIVLVSSRSPLRWVWTPASIAGALLAAASLGAVVALSARLVREGRGTPAPLAPPRELVRSGVYRRVRNPMYLAYLGVVIGEALVLRSVWLGVYSGVLFGVAHAYVVRREEPLLERRFGEAYRRYRREVPRWLPRLKSPGGPAPCP